MHGTAGQGYTDLHNIVTVQGNEPDPDYTDNADAVRTGVVQRRADLSLTKAGATSAPDNGQVTYTLKVTNNGPMASSGWILTDQFALHGRPDRCAGRRPVQRRRDRQHRCGQLRPPARGLDGPAPPR
uniref:hypothetical protein n=1 Tax=Streptomyces gibsoniae TaxID=3075529 RepID=UPI00374E000E